MHFFFKIWLFSLFFGDFSTLKMGYPQPILVEKLSKFGECGEVIHRKSPFLPVLSSKIRVFILCFFLS